MIENPISSTSLYNQCSTLNYTQAAMMGLTGTSLQESQQLGYSNHSNIPNIILTGSDSVDYTLPLMTKVIVSVATIDNKQFGKQSITMRNSDILEALGGK